MDKSLSEENGQPVDFDYVVKTVQVSPEGIKAEFLETILTYLINRKWTHKNDRWYIFCVGYGT